MWLWNSLIDWLWLVRIHDLRMSAERTDVWQRLWTAELLYFSVKLFSEEWKRDTDIKELPNSSNSAQEKLPFGKSECHCLLVLLFRAWNRFSWHKGKCRQVYQVTVAGVWGRGERSVRKKEFYSWIQGTPCQTQYQNTFLIGNYQKKQTMEGPSHKLKRNSVCSSGCYLRLQVQFYAYLDGCCPTELAGAHFWVNMLRVAWQIFPTVLPTAKNWC